MVGHTGIIPAAVAAVEKVDECVGMAVKAVKEADADKEKKLGKYGSGLTGLL